MTIKQILDEMQQTVINGEIQSPDWWLDRGLYLNALVPNMLDEMTKYEMAFKAEIVQNIEAGDSVSKATLKVESSSENYKIYQYLKAREKAIYEGIKLAKKRASVDTFQP